MLSQLRSTDCEDLQAHAYELGLTHDPSEDIMKKRSIHVHCPAGATPKVILLIHFPNLAVNGF